MNKVKILHTADLHLNNGFTASAFPYDIVEERQKDIVHTFDKIIQLAKEERVKLLLIAGDFFEQRFVQLETIHYVNDQLSTLEGTYVFILPGNHDPYHMLYHYKNFPWSSNIRVFTHEYQKVHLKDLGVIVHGIGFGYQEEKRPLLESLKCNPSNEINILMLHGSDMSQAPLKQSNYLPFNHSDLINSGFDYIALGHYHQHKLFKNVYGNVIAAYSGSPEPLGFDEEGIHGIILGEISKQQNNIKMIPISNRQYYQIDIDISHCSDLQNIKEEISATIKHYSPKQNIFSIKLTGHYSWDTGLTIEFLEKQCKEICYYIQIQDDTESKHDIDSLIGEGTLVSSYILEIQSKLKEEKDEKQRQILKKALLIGIEALRGGGYKS